MKKAVLSLYAIWTGIATASPAHAQHIFPANASFDIAGSVLIQRGSGPIISCQMGYSGTAWTDVGGLHPGHAAGGDITTDDLAISHPICSMFSSNLLSTSGFAILTYNSMGLGSGTGQFTDLDMGWCAIGSAIPLSIANLSPNGSTLQINGTYGSCSIQGTLNATFAVIS